MAAMTEDRKERREPKNSLKHSMDVVVVAAKSTWWVWSSFATAIFSILIVSVLEWKNDVEKYPVWNDSFDPGLGLGSQRCNIERVQEDDMQRDRFENEYWRKKPVILVRRTGTNRAAHDFTTKKSLQEKFHNQTIRLATFESYAKSRYETRGDFGSYLEKMQSVDADTAANTSFAFGADPYGVGDLYVLPNVVQGMDLEWHFQVAIAPSGAGLAFHWHADVFAETLHGERRWFLYPPSSSPRFNARATSAQWLRDVYSKNDPSSVSTNDEHLLECTLKQDEAIYVPVDWFHSTLSLGEAVSITTSFASTFLKDVRQRRSAHLDPASLLHIHMLDAFGMGEYEKAIQLGKQLVQLRPHSFVPHGWMGVIQTLYAQSLPPTETEAIVEQLWAAQKSSSRCVELNPLYAPCHVWLSRQQRALGLVYQQPGERSSKVSNDLLRQARESLAKASSLTSDDDDEILDPRWQPRKTTK